MRVKMIQRQGCPSCTTHNPPRRVNLEGDMKTFRKTVLETTGLEILFFF